jgi:hypothetical protein
MGKSRRKATIRTTARSTVRHARPSPSDFVRMREPPSADEAQLECPQCGAPVTRNESGDVDESSPQRVEFTCPNQHRTIVALVETDDDDLDPAAFAANFERSLPTRHQWTPRSY